uniref:Cytochrome c biogenesis protein CcsA n=1 Tax=Pleurocladia lacustris TaxID=246121 RepID=A0A1I9LVC5_9PHAE|nr:cytochrome c biogenesis protein [Pleurocladia lacustris]ANS57545.1 cytochrome c biogenesis protein [Pleurocladia lacustris]ANS57689.1 cytochrome c biogenesis protein [Pleurocladia lacustris]
MSLVSENLNLVNNSVFVSCFLCTLAYWSIIYMKDTQILRTIAKLTSRFATVSIFILLTDRWIEFGYFPLSNLYESLLFLACLLLFVYQVLEYKIQSPIFGGIILPIVLFITAFTIFNLPLAMQKASALVPALQSNWLMMHVSLMMLSYSLLIIGSSLAILYLVGFLEFENYIRTMPIREAEYEKVMQRILGLKNRKEHLRLGLHLIYKEEQDIVLNIRTNFLYNIDSWSFRSISLGFPFLTIGIIAGAVWANEAWGSYWSWDPKETWALITWLNFAAYLHVRLIVGLNGKMPAIIASLGFFVVWVCYLGVNFLGQGLHSYGWFI